MKILILYSSRDGQTKTIASYIAKQLTEAATCEIQDLSQVGQIDLSQYQQVIIGASVRYGHFSPVLNKFVNKHVAQLSQMPSAFFAVNLTARKPEKRRHKPIHMYVSFIEHSLAANVVLGIRWCSALSTLQLDRSDNDSTYYAYDWGRNRYQ